MGSHSTKVAAASHVKAAASPVTPAQQHHKKSNHTNDPEPCQEFLIHAQRTVISTQPWDDVNLNLSTRTTTTSTRRYSEPAQPAVMATDLNTEGIRHLDAFERYLAERNLMEIDYTAFVSPIPMEERPILPLPAPANVNSREGEEPEVQCIACCTQLPKKKDSLYAREVIRPCRACKGAYCISCVKSMFLSACRDSTRMPPRCCTQIHLHHIKRHMTAEELSEYKASYEEWSTPKPLYCPVPTCSTFIPDRLLPRQPGNKGKRKVDSGTGTPTSPTFHCPKCEGGICITCRQVTHPDRLCAALELGLDSDTAALLKRWGYKRCPKCSQGLKRMYGCNHMECRCGAHFCWGCMRSRDDCEGGCYGDEDYDEGSGSEPDEPEPLQGSGDDTAEEAQITGPEATESVTQTSNSGLTGIVTGTHHASRPRNLDGGAAHYWEQQDLDFGEEPTDDIQDRIWECRHDFKPYTVSLTEAISQSPSMLDMECVKCWRAMLPDINAPPKLTTTPEVMKLPRTGDITARGHLSRNRGRGGRGNAARLRPAAYVPPRGLTRSDTTVGTAPHLSARVSRFAETSTLLRIDPMEDVQPRVREGKDTTSKSQTSNVFKTAFVALSMAQECRSCSLLVCKKCADAILAQREADRAVQMADLEAIQAAHVAAAVATNTQESTHAEESTQALTSPDHDGQAPPSLFD